MNREDYIKYRNNKDGMILYEYYLEKCKSKNLLDVHTFMQVISIWPYAQEAYLKVLNEYDIKYELICIQDVKTGKTLNCL